MSAAIHFNCDSTRSLLIHPLVVATGKNSTGARGVILALEGADRMNVDSVAFIRLDRVPAFLDAIKMAAEAVQGGR
jgi:hypothetical protein